MPFTVDPSTQRGQVRYLLGDTDSTNPQWDDTGIDTFIALAPYNSSYMACALALESLANIAAANCNNVRLGYFAQQDGDKVEALRSAAQRFRDWEFNTPAFDVVEENLSPMNELKIIRNFILRTEL